MTSFRRQQYVLFATLFQVMVGFGVVVPILPHFARELGANSVQMGLLVTAWAGAQFVSASLWGALSDRVGRRPILLIGLLGFSLTFLGASLANNIWTLILARFLGGFLSSATLPTAQAYVADTSTGDERTSRMTAMSAAMNLGFICGPAIGGLLTGLGFRGTFAIVGGMGLLNLVVTLFTLPEPVRVRDESGQRRRGFSGFKAVPLALRGPEALLFILAFVATFGGSVMFSMLGFFTADRMGVGPGALAVAFTVEGVASVLFQSFLVTRISRRFGQERTVGWALVAGAAGYLLLALSVAFWQALGALVVLAFGLATLRPVITAMVSQRTRLEQGITMGIQNSFDALGRSLGPLVAGLLYLWQDWAPFVTAGLTYLVFYVIASAAWRGREEEPRPA